MVKFHISLFAKIAWSLIILFSISFVSIGYLLVMQQNAKMESEREKLLLTNVKTLAQGSIDALISNDFELLENWLNAVTPEGIYAYGYLSDKNGMILVDTDTEMIGKKITLPPNVIYKGTVRILHYKNKEVKEIVYSSVLKGELIANAHIAYYISHNIFDMLERENFLTLFASVLFSLVLILWVTLLIVRRYTEPIVALTQAIGQFSFNQTNETFSKELTHRADEIGVLAVKFQLMTERLSMLYNDVKEREHTLQEKVKERTQNLEEKNKLMLEMQDQLVEREKMSALGGLVAGVAHEVNTPLGVSITAASLFEHEIDKLEKMIADNNLSREDLEGFFKNIHETQSVLTVNLQRAAKLIKNFKKISVDQSSESIRDFELNSYLQEIFATFKSEFKHRPISMKFSLAKDDIEMISKPGALSQVMINLLQNTLLHAFEVDEKGEISIESKIENEFAIIRYCDNGKGIESSVTDTIFNPFVTTKRNQGGTGLGLYITYNLVTQSLGGSIELDSQVEQGSCFIVKIPFNIEE